MTLYNAHGAPIRRRIGFIAGFAPIRLKADITLADCIGSSITAESEDPEAEPEILTEKETT